METEVRKFRVCYKKTTAGTWSIPDKDVRFKKFKCLEIFQKTLGNHNTSTLANKYIYNLLYLWLQMLNKHQWQEKGKKKCLKSWRNSTITALITYVSFVQIRHKWRRTAAWLHINRLIILLLSVGRESTLDSSTKMLFLYRFLSLYHQAKWLLLRPPSPSSHLTLFVVAVIWS